MRPNIEWLDDPEVFRVGQLSAHSDHKFYLNYDELAVQNSCLIQSLNGEWRFKYAKEPQHRSRGFWQKDYKLSGFNTISVPQHIEFAGYDKFQYINIMYGWEGQVQRLPAYTEGQTVPVGSFSKGMDNAVGSYIKKFDLNSELFDRPIRIRFDGVEQAMFVWLNGSFIGYAEDSFTPSEFDLTPFIQKKDNVLAVEVFKRSSAAFLEDQDFFQFFGIFRNVTLIATPKLHIEDLDIKPTVNDDFQTGNLDVKIRIAGKCQEDTVRIKVLDHSGHQLLSVKEDASNKLEFSNLPTINNVQLWDNSNPYCYQLRLELYDKNNQLLEVVPYSFGFRKIEIKNKIILLNGKRLVIKGVNRHEWNAESGRVITKSDMQQDISIIKHNHINAVRTSHYPDQTLWYYLCDKSGIYVMAETNMETHGSWQNGLSWNVPGSIPQWRAAVLDRAQNNYELLKNHPSILFWSLGNESYVGKDISLMNDYFKSVDASRLTHYEGVSHDVSYRNHVSDVESRMYATPKNIEDYLSSDPKKPFILCEFMHSMGNSLGGMQDYMKLIDKYPMYQGGFIWDFIDQAISITDKISGKRVLRYGGDFDDRPSDYDFSGDGLLFADRTEKPAMREVRYYYGQYK